MKKILVLLCVLFLVFGIVGTTSAYTIDGLAAEYLFNGDAQDSSGNKNHGTVNGAVLTTDRFGDPDSAYSFEGRDVGIDIPNNPSLEPAHLTLSAWIYWMAGDNPYYNSTLIVDNYSTEPYGYDFAYDNDRKILMFHLFPESAAGVPLYCDLDLTSGGWEFVAVTYDGADMKMYANDSLLGTASNPNGYHPSSATNTTIGTASHAPYSGLVGSHFFQGLIDDVRIYDRALSQGEIIGLYNAPTSVPDASVMLLLAPSLIGLVALRKR